MTVTATHCALPGQDAPVERFSQEPCELSELLTSDSAPTGMRHVRPLRLESVIVPLDGARYAEHALPLAMEIAAASKASLWLESAYSLFGHAFDDSCRLSFEEASSPRRRVHMHAYLKALADRASSDAVPIACRLREAAMPAWSLREVAGENSLVVIAQRSHRLADPFRLGHGVERILKFGSSPLIFVRGYRWPYMLRPGKKTTHILVVLDGTPEAEHVLPAAMAIAEAVEAKTTLLRLVPSMPNYEVLQAEKEAEAKAYLKDVRQAIERRRAPVESALWSSDRQAGEAVLSYAQNGNADLIALATSLRPTLVGAIRRESVRYLVRKSRTPLLIVSADKVLP